MHWRLPRAWQLALASHVLAALLLPAADTFAVLGWGSRSDRFAAEILVTGIVFNDLDSDGERDLEEPGLGGVVVSNGVEVQSTASDGTFSLTVVRDDSRFVLLTVPRGYRATHGFFHRVGPEVADSAAFGLIADPAADQAEFRFVHASDPHVFDATTSAQFTQSLAEIAALEPPVDFVVVTGDLVNAAHQLANAASALVSPPVTVHAGFGDHDADPDSLHTRTFENLIGPSYYSFDRGPYHFVIHNDVRSASLADDFKQLTWLANDIAAVPPDRQIFVFTHFQPDRAEIDLYKNLGVDAIFSGHWHGNRTQGMEGILSFNSGTVRMGGIDRSSRGFRVVELGGEGGSVTSEVRTGGIAPRIVVVNPPAGVVPFGSVKIRAMGYATSHPGAAARFTVTGPSGVVAAGDLVPEGGWCYGGVWETAGLEQADYDLSVELTDANGVLASESHTITLEPVVEPIVIPGGPWPCFRGNVSGTGRLATELTPPLSLAWSSSVGGATELSSPIVADGRVFIAHGSSGPIESAALVAFDLLTGNELWRHPTGAEVKGTPAVSGGRVVALTSNGQIEAFDAETGALVWSTALGDSANRHDLTSPTISDGVVFAGGPRATAALDLATGDVLWERSLGDDWLATIYSVPIVSGSRVIYGIYSGLHVLDRTTGTTIWSRATDDRETYRSPAIAGGVLYGAGDNFGSQMLRAFDLDSGAELWSAPYPLGNSNSAPAVADSLILIGSGNGSLEAFARSDGHSVWSLAVDAPIACGRPYARDVSTVTSSPLVAGELAYVGADDGVLRAVQVADGTVAWSTQLGAPIRSSPAASGNVLLICTTDGTLFTFVSGDYATTGTGDSNGAPPARTAIGVPWPNPIAHSGTIPFELGGRASAVAARLAIYDVTGRKVRTLTEATLPRGRHQAHWDGRDADGRQVASGIYFLRLDVDGKPAATARLSLVH